MSAARILAVDDQLYFRVYLEDLLRDAQYEVVSAGSGPEALALLERESFDVVLTDLVMPGMDGSELVQRVKERWPSQEIVVITSVGDVKTAVDAMKLGATDYLLKPLDRIVLLRCLEAIAERRRTRDENRRLTAENLDYLSAFAQYERILGLFSTQAVEPLSDRIVEALCLETNAHGGVSWIARNDAPERLRLAGVSGLVRIEGEPAELFASELPEELRALAAGTGKPLRAAANGEGARDCLYVPLARAGRLLGIVRLSDKLDGSEFGDADLAVAERMGAFAGLALANAFAFRALERRSFRDPVTRAYTKAYLDDVVENEVQKSRRFARSFSLVRLQLDGVSDPLASAALARAVEGFAAEISRALRAADLLAVEDDGAFYVFLPETDGLGAAMAKRRLRAALERCDARRALPEAPVVLAAAATFPSDDSRGEDLWRTLAARVGEDRASFVRSRDLEQAPFRGLVDALLAEAPNGPGALAEQAGQFLVDEIVRNPAERGLLFVGAGERLGAPIRGALERLRGLSARTDVIVVGARSPDEAPGLPVTWVSPQRAGTDAPFLLYFGDRPAYALVSEPGEAREEVVLYHTADRVLVEHLAFQLSRDLGIPIGG